MKLAVFLTGRQSSRRLSFMQDQTEHTLLAKLAEYAGIAADYHDIAGTLHSTSDDTRRAILTAMGFAVDSVASLTQALQEWEEATWRRPCDPVRILRDGESGGSLSCCLALDEGKDASVAVKWEIRNEANAVVQEGVAGLGLFAAEVFVWTLEEHVEVAFGVGVADDATERTGGLKRLDRSEPALTSERLPALRTLIYEDGSGLRDYEGLLSYGQVQENGRGLLGSNAGFLDAEIAKGKGADPSVMLYTSGTTGRPKGVVLTYDNLRKSAENAARFEGLTERDELLCYLPMAWVGDHMLSYAQAIVTGFTINCPESAATVLHDLKEIGPTYFFAPPRIWENLLTNVLIRIEDAARPKRALVHLFLRLAQDLERRRLAGQPLPWLPRLVAPLGHLLVHGPLRDNLGLRRVRRAYTAGEAIGPEIFVFFRGLGVNVKQLYGQTEASVFVSIQKDGDVRLETVGTPLSEVEIRISPEGEVLYRSPGVFLGYYKNPEATAQTIRDGLLYSGDAAMFDPDGHLVEFTYGQPLEGLH